MIGGRVGLYVRTRGMRVSTCFCFLINAVSLGTSFAFCMRVDTSSWVYPLFKKSLHMSSQQESKSSSAVHILLTFRACPYGMAFSAFLGGRIFYVSSYAYPFLLYIVSS